MLSLDLFRGEVQSVSSPHVRFQPLDKYELSSSNSTLQGAHLLMIDCSYKLKVVSGDAVGLFTTQPTIFFRQTLTSSSTAYKSSHSLDTVPTGRRQRYGEARTTHHFETICYRFPVGTVCVKARGNESSEHHV